MHARKEDARLQIRAWRARNPEKVKASRDAWKMKNRTRYDRLQFFYHLRRKFGLSQEQLNEIIVTAMGHCGCCGDELRDEVHVDHDHVTGRVRGLLCRSCNLGLGFFKDSPERLFKAIEYLEKVS